MVVMKKLGIALLLLAACAREGSAVVESTSRPADANAPPAQAAAPPAVAGPKLAFVDEAAKDPSFETYRTQLLAAVQARNTRAVLALSDPNIRTSFGGDGDAAALESVLDDALWRELEDILTLGGSFIDEMFWAPYVYSAWPESHDAFETFAVTGDDVPLRGSPDASAPAIATLARDLVARASEPRQDEAWVKVTTADGRTGFVESKFVRSPVDYRAGFTRTEDGWRMTALVAGD